MFKIKFLRRVLFASLAIAILLPLYNIYIAYPSFTSALLKETERESIHIASHLIPMFNLEDLHINSDEMVIDLNIIENTIESFHLEKLKIFSASGKNIYSTDRKDIGLTNRNEYFHNIVAKGKTYTKHVKKNTLSLEGQLINADVVETYVPIMKNDIFLGAMEIYYDITNETAIFNKLRQRSNILLIVLTIGLVFIVFITSRKASKIILERERLENILREMSITDELTGIHNRRGFFAVAEHRLKIAQREKIGLLLLYADVDNLKEINDTFGHDEGDKLLKETANILKTSYRDSDIVARIGGDEFVAFPVGTTKDNDEKITSRLQKNIEIYNVKSKNSYKLSISIGISIYDPESVKTIDELLANADKSMYEEKRGKQNS